MAEYMTKDEIAAFDAVRYAWMRALFQYAERKRVRELALKETSRNHESGLKCYFAFKDPLNWSHRERAKALKALLRASRRGEGYPSFWNREGLKIALCVELMALGARIKELPDRKFLIPMPPKPYPPEMELTRPRFPFGEGHPEYDLR